MKQAHVTPADRRVVAPALARAEKTGAPAAAIELSDGTLITGRTSELLGSTSAALLNALKVIAGVPHEIRIISPEAIAPIQTLKTSYLGSKNPRLHTDEVLIALSTSAAHDPKAAAVLDLRAGLREQADLPLNNPYKKPGPWARFIFVLIRIKG